MAQYTMAALRESSFHVHCKVVATWAPGMVSSTPPPPPCETVKEDLLADVIRGLGQSSVVLEYRMEQFSLLHTGLFDGGATARTSTAPVTSKNMFQTIHFFIFSSPGKD